jgi:Flp pilus assembly protein CpaB
LVLQSWWKINRWLIIGVLALAIAVYATLRVLALRPQQAATNSQTVTVLVVAKAIPVDSPILGSDLVERSYPVDLVPPGAYRGSLAGQLTTEALYPGQVLVTSDFFSPKTADQIPVRIPKGDVAYDLALPSQSEVDGVIAPGDRVTIFTSLSAGSPGGGSTGATMVFLEHVNVLAVNGLLASSNTPGSEEQLILAVTPTQAEALVYASTHSTLTIVLERPKENLGKVSAYGSSFPAAPH